jgi:GMP synthase-like glutamine amidotransferase/DNA-binding CsgD family transcriptional regulator
VRALALEHLRPDPVGVFGEVLAERGIGVDRVMLYEGDPLPDWRRYDLIVAMGAGVSVWQEDEYLWIADEKRTVREAVLAGLPYFGVCFGVQLLADVFGAESFRGPEPEIGVNQVFLTAAARHDAVFRGFPPDLEVCEWHSNHFSLPSGAVRLARSPRYENQAIRYGRVAYGIQCHLEPSLDDIRAWLEEFPDSAATLEQRHGPGSVDRLLDDYADFVPFLQETARQVFGRWLENALAFGRLGGAVRAAGGGRLQPGGGRTPTGGRTGSERFGRGPELARIDSALASARRGESAVLVLRGAAGIGKTALLDAAGERAHGLRVLRVSGEDSGEAERPFEGLAELLRVLPDALDRLSPRRRDAVAAILGLGARAPVSDRFAVYAAALDLLAAAAAEQPLLLLVDDAHLLDESSAEALAFIAGRLGTDGIALLVATESENDFAGGEDVGVGGLAPPDARALLDARSDVELSVTAADRIVDVAGGNPLALLELPLDLTPDQRAGRARLGEELPSSAEWAFLRRVTALAPPARKVLLVAALAGPREVEAVPRACSALGLDDDALAAAKTSLLVDEDETDIVFRHPLARTAVMYSALRADRLATHAALADALQGDSRSWHQARAAARPDEAVAGALARIAAAARDVGAFGTAARALERAARLTPSHEQRAMRLLEAARTAHLAGHVNAAIGYVDSALRSNGVDPWRRTAEHLRGRIIARSGSAPLARDQLVAVASRCEVDQPALAAQILADAVLPALRAGGPAEAVRIARRATRLAATGGGQAALAARVALGIALIFAGEYLEGAALVDAAAELEEHADPQQRTYLGVGLLLAGRHVLARRVLAEVVGEARTAGAVSAVPYALIRLANVELETGRWPAAAAALHEAQRLARETGQVADYGLALGALAWLEAARGQDDECRGHVEEALELAERLGSGSRVDRSASALGLLALGRAEPDPAIAHLEEACRLQDELGWSDAATTPHCRPDLIEAYALAGRGREARETLERFQRDAERTGRHSALAAGSRCRAFLAPAADVDAEFADALGQVDCAGPFDRARTELLHGMRLMDTGRPEDGKRVLADALATFEALEAWPWAQRARASLITVDETLTGRRAGLSDRLSERELEVALAAADGGSALEIAERLFLGPRTVALLLASATIKLGLQSPAQLADAIRRDGRLAAAARSRHG